MFCCNPIHKVYYEGFVEQWNDVINQTSSTKHCCVRYCDLIFCFGLRTTDLSLLLGLVDAANLVFIFSCQSAWNYSDCCFFRLSHSDLQTQNHIKYFTFEMSSEGRKRGFVPRFWSEMFLSACIQFMSAFLRGNLCFIFDIYLKAHIL